MGWLILICWLVVSAVAYVIQSSPDDTEADITRKAMYSLVVPILLVYMLVALLSRWISRQTHKVLPFTNHSEDLTDYF